MFLAMRVAILAVDGVFDTGLAVLRDAFATANELAPLAGLAESRFEVTVTGVRRRVRSALGVTVPLVARPARGRPDWAVVPAIGCKMPGPLEAALARPEIADAGAALRDWSARGARLAAACIGTFVAAESGVLDGHEATTTWWLAPLFRRRYPRIRLDESRMVVPSGDVVTAGAALGHMDLALWLIRQRSPELAALVARYLIVDTRPSQSAYALVDHLAHADPLVERFERWARSHLAEGFSLDAAAAAASTSKRTLARRLEATLGRTPLGFFQDLRVERAVHLLKTTDASAAEVAHRVGYADGITLGNLLRRRLGRGLRELRRGGR